MLVLTVKYEKPGINFDVGNGCFSRALRSALCDSKFNILKMQKHHVEQFQCSQCSQVSGKRNRSFTKRRKTKAKLHTCSYFNSVIVLPKASILWISSLDGVRVLSDIPYELRSYTVR